MLDGGWVMVHRARLFGHRILRILGTTSRGGVCAYACVWVCVCRDSYRILCLGGGTQHLGESGGMFPQEFFFKVML